MRILITGSSGYYGSILYTYLESKGISCFGLDISPSLVIPADNQIVCDLCNKDELSTKLMGMKFDVLIHLASQIDFAVNSQESLYENNVSSTSNLIVLAKNLGISKFIFTSSNSIFLGNKKTCIEADDIPVPIDEYGKSKLSAEKLLVDSKGFDVNILRCPNIIDAGRVGMLSILFELIRGNSTLWVIGGGNIRHQCLYAQDLNSAIFALLQYNGSTIHNIGSDGVPTFSGAFQSLVDKAGSKSKIRSLPGVLVIPILKMLHKLGVSPLGPYQFRMLTQNFEFNLSKIKKDLNWAPTKNNTEILSLAYDYYCNNMQQIKNNKSANSAPVKMGALAILRYIKW